ncbi:hypothetical protein DFH11DRAFT_1735401 [Phellopilus nigrolimitatus]|nr:hypothetical protein DFH11DRAFT_1735401 [Phellopilus nigrolimitatus]
MAMNREDKRDDGKQHDDGKRPAGTGFSERDENDIVELFGAIIRTSLLLILSLLRVAQRGLVTVVDDGNTHINDPPGGPRFPDFRSYLLRGSASQGIPAAGHDVTGAGAFVPTNSSFSAVKAEGESSSSMPGPAGPSSAGLYSSQKRTRWYVITAGLRTGVFNDWLEAGRYVSGVTGAIYKGYDSEEEATDAFNEAVRAGHVRVVPDINNILNRVKLNDG